MAASLFCPHCGALNPVGKSACFACGHALAAPASDAPGAQRVLRQRYRLLRQIGVGGFGAVYKAEDIELGNRLVAVKEMSARGLTLEEVQEATDGFHREALLLARLSHPNLPRIYEQFEEAGRWYLVMDFIEGQTLEDYLAQRGGRLPVNEALALGLQLTSVLGYLHSRQPPIVFRDLKPSNVIRTPEGQVYLIDFGIARLFKPGQAKDTIAFGSPGYAAPEQYGKAQTTPRSDVFSLGALLHHLLTGVDPSDTPFRFKPLTKHHPAGLSTLIERMVDLDAEKRPATMELVRRDLERMLNDHSSRHAGDDAQVLPGAYITPMSAQATGGSPHVTFAASSWQGQQSLPAQGVQVLHPTPTRRKINKWWVLGSVLLFLCVGIPLLFNLGHSSCSTCDPNFVGEDSPTDTPVPSLSSVRVFTLSWSHDGNYIASGGDDGQVEIWDVASSQQKTVINTSLAEVITLAWSPDSQYLAAAGDGGQVQIRQADGSLVTSYRFGSSSIDALSWSPDSKQIALASYDGAVGVVDVLTGNNSWGYQRDSEPVTTVAWSPNGKYIASGGGDQTVQVWNSTTRKPAYSYHDNQGAIEAVVWSPDSKRVASGDTSYQMQVWDALTGHNLFTFSSDSIVNAVAWSPNGRYLASGGDDWNVEVWALGNNTPLFTYTKHEDTIRAIAWSPGSQQIASAGDDGTVHIWQALGGGSDVSYQQV
jgi:eukaryotic-like serine/threonine-protein kinase